VTDQVAAYNAELFQKRAGSRTSVFLAWIRRWSFGDRLISAAGTTKIFGQE